MGKRSGCNGSHQLDTQEKGSSGPWLRWWSTPVGVEDEEIKETVKSRRAQFHAHSLLEVKAIVEAMNGISYRSSTFARTKGY